MDIYWTRVSDDSINSLFSCGLCGVAVDQYKFADHDRHHTMLEEMFKVLTALRGNVEEIRAAATDFGRKLEVLSADLHSLKMTVARHMNEDAENPPEALRMRSQIHDDIMRQG